MSRVLLHCDCPAPEHVVALTRNALLGSAVCYSAKYHYEAHAGAHFMRHEY